MSYKTILVHVSQSQHTLATVKVAAAIAQQQNAHLIGAAATAMPAAYYLPGYIGESNSALSVYLESMRIRAANSLSEFDDVAKQAGVNSIEQRLVDDEATVAISQGARYCDLVVIGQNDPDESMPDLRHDLPDHVVLNCGRPVLIVPYAGKFDTVGKKVLVAWDASMEATRAVSAAIPLLKHAALVQLLVFNPKVAPKGHGEMPGADIALYLARHGVKVEVLQRAAVTDIDIGDALLSHAADVGSDLLVMGGYGHSRIREIMLGGVTSTILKSMTIPVLMAH